MRSSGISYCLLIVAALCWTVKANDLLIANDASNNPDAILRYNSTTGAFISSFLSTPIVSPTSMTYGPDGNLYVASSATHSITRYQGQSGQFIDTFVASQSGGLSNAYDMSFGPDGSLYVAEHNKILRYSGATGAFLGAWAATGTNALTFAEGVTFGSDGKMYVADYDRLKRFDAAGVYVNDFPNAAHVEGSGRLRFGLDGNLYVPTNGGIYRFNGVTGAFIGSSPYGDNVVFREDGKGLLDFTSSVNTYDWKTGSGTVLIHSNDGHLSNITAMVLMVPEPGTVLWGALAALVLFRRR